MKETLRTDISLFVYLENRKAETNKRGLAMRFQEGKILEKRPIMN